MNYRSLVRRGLVFILISLHCVIGIAQSTSWTGADDTAWRNAANWTNGVPDETTDVIIGDANFTGSFQPILEKGRGSGSCINLTIGNGVKVSTLESNDALEIAGTLIIGINGNILHDNGYIYVTGNFDNSGTYTADNSNRRVYMSGTSQNLGGTATTTFEKLYIEAGSITTLTGNIVVNNKLELTGTLNPTATYSVSGTGEIELKGTGVLKVMASTYAGNYTQSAGLSFKGNNSTIDYASSTVDQTIHDGLSYRNLEVSGGMIKSLQGNTVVSGNLSVEAGTLDLITFSIDRNSNGGSLSVARGATLKIGGTQSFPNNYADHILASTSTVNYYGSNQTVTNESYGNLTLSSSGGSTVKTMPGLAMTVAGNLSSSVSAGSLLFTAGNDISVLGNIDIGSGTSFDGSTFDHSTSGNVQVEGIYTGASGSFTSNGSNASWSGGGTYTMGDFTINGANTTLHENSSFSITGDLSTAISGSVIHTTGGTGSITMTGTGNSISGLGIILDDLDIGSGASISVGSDIEIAGNLTVDGILSDASNEITLSGASKTISASGTLELEDLAVTGSINTTSDISIGGNLLITDSFTATAGTVTFDGTTDLSGTASLFNVTVDNGSTLNMGVEATLNIAGTDALVGTGSFDGTSDVPNTVNYNAIGAQSINFTDFYNLTLENAGTKTPAAALTINGDLIIGVGTIFDGSSFTHTLQGDWVNNGTFTAGTSTFQLTGADNTSITGATTFNDMTVNKSSTNVVTLNDDVSVTDLAVTSGIIQTGTNTVTITATRTGNGIILGTITRQHSFTTATDYAFEGPNNTINFTSIVGAITSITVVVDNKTLSTFPYRESINRVYDISVSGGVTSYSAKLRLHYETVDINGNDESTMTLWNDQGTTTWVEIGSSSNSTADNWVEETGLTSLEDKWSLSDGLKVVSWTGAVSSLSSDAGNWTSTAGSPSIPPGIDDVVVIGDETFTNQPTLNVTASVKRIIFESTTESTATVASGTTLTVSGNILGDWTGGAAAHSLNVGSANLVVNGDLELSDETSGNTIDITASTGTISVLGSVQQSGGADITFTGAGALNIGEDYEYSSGTFTPGSSTVTYDGADNQIVGGVTYNNLTIDKSGGLATTGGNVEVGGDLTMTTGDLTLANNLDINGNLSVGAGTTLSVGSSNINLEGDFTLDGTFDPGTSTFELDGSGEQGVEPATYHNIQVDKASGTASLTGDIYLKGNAMIIKGTLDAGTHSIIRTSTGGFADLGAGGTILLAGGSTQVQNFASLTIDPASTVHFNGSISRVIPPFEYGNLVFSNSGTKFLFGNTDAKGDLTINSGATFDISNFTFGLEGDLTIDGTLETTDSFLELNGTDKDINGTTDFDEVLVNGSYDYQSGNPTFNGHVEIASTGDFDLGAATVTISGDLTNRGTAVSNGTVTFTGAQQQTIRLLNAITSASSGIINFNGSVAPNFASTSSPQFATVNINNTAGITPSLPWTVAVSMTVGSGASFNAGSLDHTFLGHFVNNGTVSSDGEMTFNPIYFPSTITLGNNFTSNGTVTLGGTQAITLTDNTPNFSFITISNSNASGVSAASDWTVSETMLISSGATFNADSYSHTISGAFINEGDFNGQTSTVTFNGTSNSIIGLGSTSFNDLIFDTGATLEVNSSISLTGDFTNNATSLDLANALVEFSGSSQSIISGTSPAFSELTINKSSSNTRLDVDVTISDGLTMTDGLLDLNGNELSITNSAASVIGRTSGLILSESTDNSSKVNWAIGTDTDNHEIPFGNASGDYIPFSFELASGDAGTVSVSTYPTAADNTPYPTGVTNVDYYSTDNSNNTVDRFFQIDLAGESSPEATISLSASSSEVGSITELVGQRWNGTKWEDALPGQSATATSVTIPGVTQFSPWAMSGNGVPLPVELVSFTAGVVNDQVRLNWETASEINNKGFYVQRSTDGKSFENLSFLNGHGDSDDLIKYQFSDNRPLDGLSFYRLKQVDFDGAFDFSKTLTVRMKTDDLAKYNFYPNPLSGSQLKLKTEGVKTDKLELRLITLEGRQVWSRVYGSEEVTSLIEVDFGRKLDADMYLMEARTSLSTRQFKIMIEE